MRDMMQLVPMVVEQSARGERSFDIYSRLLRERIIGDLRVIRATFGFSAGFNAEGRLFKNALGGGGILDVGGYPISMVRLIAAHRNEIRPNGWAHRRVS